MLLLKSSNPVIDNFLPVTVNCFKLEWKRNTWLGAFCNDNWLGALHEEIKEIPQIDIILSNKMESSLHWGCWFLLHYFSRNKRSQDMNYYIFDQNSRGSLISKISGNGGFYRSMNVTNNTNIQVENQNMGWWELHKFELINRRYQTQHLWNTTICTNQGNWITWESTCWIQFAITITMAEQEMNESVG